MIQLNRISPARALILGFLLVLISTFTIFGQSNASVPPGGTPGPVRRALIVGNGDYERQRLANPANDARDLAAALEETGFEVLLRTDRDLEEMESDLRAFREVIQPGDVTLFFFAGHGVQVDGRNYLLPVNNRDIRDNTELRRKAIDAHAYVETMVEAGAGINIVMLDACRDNPLPASSRGGSRGLSAMDPPRGSETVIVFATQAGDVAADGDGDNSTFTSALLEEIHTPDVELVSLFNRVGSDVRDRTGGKQVPTIYSEPLSQPFFFMTSEMIAARARAESNAAQAEVDVLENEIAAYQARIDAAADERERRELEVEQQRQQALLAAQRIEARQLAEEAARREEQAQQAEEQRRQREEQVATAQAEQAELARLASARRQEMQRLAEDARSEDPDILIAT
ncbi:MAG: caspase family protein, partial [Spirochaeta sp.]|nr:caspase family protein [Spirochaeta sp.]